MVGNTIGGRAISCGGDGRSDDRRRAMRQLPSARVAALQHREPIDEPVNFGSGQEVTILYLAERIIELFGKTGSIKPVLTAPRMGEVQRLIADAARAKEVLGWEPEYDLDRGLQEFVEWYGNHGLEERIQIE